LNPPEVSVQLNSGPIHSIVVECTALGVSDYADDYSGRGGVGPTIPRQLIKGWWEIKGTDDVQTFP
jgi:hypothetical protein